MKHHAFSSRATAALAGMTILLIGGTSTGALAAVTTASAQQDTPGAPGAPTGLTATPGNGAVTLSWSAPSSDGGQALTGYVVEGGTDPSDLGVMQNVSSPSATITGLTSGTTYYFEVLAENGIGDTPSTVVRVPVPINPPHPPQVSVPGAPTGLKPIAGDHFIGLSWTPPAQTGGSAITAYHVYVGYNKLRMATREYTTTSSSFRLTDVENGVSYWLEVKAVNSAGEGLASVPVTATPSPASPPPPATPPAPTGLTARAGHGAVTLSWSPPKGGLKAGEDYVIYLGTRSHGETALRYKIHGTSASITRLTAGTRYYFEVALVAGGQTSNRSAEVSTVPVPIPGSSSGSQPGSVGGGSSSSNSNEGVQSTPSPAGPPSPGVVVTSPADSSSSLPVGLIAMLVGLALAAGAGVAALIMRLRRRGYGPRHGSVPAPRDPYDDDQLTRTSSRPDHRVDEMDGPRYR